MKKVIIGLGTAAIIAAGVGPVITGNMAEKELQVLVAQLNEQSSDSVTIDAYEKGYLTAKARLLLAMDTGVPELDSQPVSVDVAIEHGPILLQSSNLGLAAITVNIPTEMFGLTEVLGTEQLASYKAELGFSDSIKHTFKLLPIELKQGMDFAFTGLEANINSNRDLSQVKGDVNIGEAHFNYTDPNTGLASNSAMQASQVQVNWQEEPGHKDVMSGFSEWRAPEISMKSGMFNVALNDVVVKAESKVEGDAIKLSQALSVKSVTGPMPIENINYSFTLSNIKLATYEAFLAMSDVIDSMSQDPGASEDEEALKALVRPLFQKGIRNDQALSLELAGGTIKADLKAEFVGDESSADALFAQNDEQFLAAFAADLTASADKQAVMTTPLAFMMPGWAQQGLVQMHDDKFTFEAAIKDAQLNLNGQIMPLIAFLEPKPEEVETPDDTPLGPALQPES